GIGINGDRIAVLEESDRSAVPRLRSDVAHHQPMRAAGKASIRDETDLVAEPLTDQRCRDRQHLAHAGSADRPFAPNDDDVARINLPLLDGLEAYLLALINLGWTSHLADLDARDLGHGPLRRQVAMQNDKVA